MSKVFETTTNRNQRYKTFSPEPDQLVTFEGGIANGYIKRIPHQTEDIWVMKQKIGDAWYLDYFTEPQEGTTRYYNAGNKVFKVFEWDIDFLSKTPEKEKCGLIYNSRGEEIRHYIVAAHLDSGTLIVQLRDMDGKHTLNEIKGEIYTMEIKVWGLPLRFVPVPITPREQVGDEPQIVQTPDSGRNTGK